MSINIFGPGHYVNTGEVTSRPSPIATGKENDTWFAQCDAEGNGGTNIDEMWLNQLVAVLRQAVRTAGASQAELSDVMVAEAMARYASGGVFAVDTGAANAYVLTASGTFQGPKSYFHGMMVVWTPTHENNAASTANAFDLGAKAILAPDGSALAGGELGLLATAMWYDSAAAGGVGAFRLFPWAVLGGGGGQASRFGECRLIKSGSNLVLMPFNGNRVSFPSGTTMNIPDTGVSLTPSGLSSATLYYIYAKVVSNALALEASTTGHVQDASTGIEIKSGDATRVLVGAAYIIAGPNFSDTDGARYVLSWFNRRLRSSLTTFSATRSTSTTPPLFEINSEIRSYFLKWADDEVVGQINGRAGSVGYTTSLTQVSFNGGAIPKPGTMEWQTHSGGGNYGLTVTSLNKSAALSEGLNYATLFGCVRAGTIQYFGSDADYACVSLHVFFWG